MMSSRSRSHASTTSLSSSVSSSSSSSLYKIQTTRLLQPNGSFEVVLRRTDVLLEASERLRGYYTQSLLASDDPVTEMYQRVMMRNKNNGGGAALLYNTFNKEVQGSRFLTSIEVPVSVVFNEGNTDGSASARFIITVSTKNVKPAAESIEKLMLNQFPPPALPGRKRFKNPEEVTRMRSKDVLANYDLYVYPVPSSARDTLIPAYILYFTNVFTILRGVDDYVYALCAAFAEGTYDTTDVGGTFVSSKLRIVP